MKSSHITGADLALARELFAVSVDMKPDSIEQWWSDLVPQVRDSWIEVAIHVGALRLNPHVPIPMLLLCPSCGARHIDEGEFATKPHHTHACQCCGMVWRPAIANTVGVQFLPGFKNATP